VPKVEGSGLRFFGFGRPATWSTNETHSGQIRKNERVRRWASTHLLPVVAMESIPHIYRRAGFPHRATPIEVAPREGSSGPLHRMAKVYQANHTQTVKVATTDSRVVRTRFPSGPHAAKPHANPFVQRFEPLRTSCKRRREIIGRPANDSVQSLHDFGIQITMPLSQRSHLVLELLHGFVPHADRPRRDEESEEGKSFRESRHLRLLGTQLEPEFGKHTFHQRPCLLGLAFGSAQHDKIVGVSHEAKAGGVQLPVQMVQGDVCQQRGDHASNDIANKGGFLDRLIPRERLKPRYGSGWRSP